MRQPSPQSRGFWCRKINNLKSPGAWIQLWSYAPFIFPRILLPAWPMVRLMSPCRDLSRWHTRISSQRLQAPVLGYPLSLILANLKGTRRQIMASNPSHKLSMLVDHRSLSSCSSGDTDCKLVYIRPHSRFIDGIYLLRYCVYNYNGPYRRYHDRCTRNCVPGRQ